MNQIVIDSEEGPSAHSYAAGGLFVRLTDALSALGALATVNFTADDMVTFVGVEGWRYLLHRGRAQESLAQLAERIEAFRAAGLDPSKGDLMQQQGQYRLTVHVGDARTGQQVREILVSCKAQHVNRHE